MFRMMSCTIKIQINMFKTDDMNGYIQAYAGLYTNFLVCKKILQGLEKLQIFFTAHNSHHQYAD